MIATRWQRVEGLLMAVAGLGIAIAVGPGWPWWLWIAALLAPDLSMLGYLAGPRIGAITYNAFHLYGTGLVLALLGLVTASPTLIATGAVWMAHVGADRALAYGLKAASDFKDTHLGRIGN